MERILKLVFTLSKNFGPSECWKILGKYEVLLLRFFLRKSGERINFTGIKCTKKGFPLRKFQQFSSRFFENYCLVTSNEHFAGGPSILPRYCSTSQITATIINFDFPNNTT